MNRTKGRSSRQILSDAPRAWMLRSAQTLQARHGGWLNVTSGPGDRASGAVWLTRGDGQDLVLAAGQGLWLAPGQEVVVEPWSARRPVGLQWREVARQPLRRGAVARPALAWLERLRAGWAALGGLAGRLAAAARSAASSASRAQGRIRAGDSIASSGALQ